MKKQSILIIAILILTLCLVGFAASRLAPASPVSAASESHLVSSSVSPAENVSATPTLAAQPVVYLVTGIVCTLFGVLAIAPLILGDPNR